jgi:hypothetical protein
MIRVLALVSLMAGSLSQSACMVVGPARQPVAAAPPRCHPSQYWDGQQCRHKGQGWGARKHDGR